MILAGVVGQLVSKRMTSGDEDSDDFRLATIFGGREFDSRATALRSASALAVMGWSSTSGRPRSTRRVRPSTSRPSWVGIEITLPPGWAVDVENHGKLGGVDTRVTDSAGLPADAPTLHVTTNAWFGGVEISA